VGCVQDRGGVRARRVGRERRSNKFRSGSRRERSDHAEGANRSVGKEAGRPTCGDWPLKNTRKGGGGGGGGGGVGRTAERALSIIARVQQAWWMGAGMLAHRGTGICLCGAPMPGARMYRVAWIHH